MCSKPNIWAEVDDQGRLVLPADVVTRYGLQPGARVRIDAGENDLRLHRPVTHLAKVYVEPTNRCNIACRTCMRNVWEVEYGRMSSDTFDHILEGLRAISPPPTVFFGGLGEPLAHPEIIEMIKQVKELGTYVELITNGTLLDEKLSRQLVASGLDVLWVSIDGAKPESYADVRLGAVLPDVIDNLVTLRNARSYAYIPKPEIGIVFVAMKQNVADLPDVLAIGRHVRATRFLVTNVLPYTPELISETLYEKTLKDVTYMSSPWLRKLSLPKMDINHITEGAFLRALHSGYNVSFAGNNLGVTSDVCTFIESGSMAIGWDGNVSPCPPLLYTHSSYLHGIKRVSYRHLIGNVNESELIELWNDPEYVAYRDRVHRFAFAPCTFCGGCDLSEANQEDCLGNEAPACGACLWAQGVIQCP